MDTEKTARQKKIKMDTEMATRQNERLEQGNRTNERDTHGQINNTKWQTRLHDKIREMDTKKGTRENERDEHRDGKKKIER